MLFKKTTMRVLKLQNLFMDNLFMSKLKEAQIYYIVYLLL